MSSAITYKIQSYKKKSNRKNVKTVVIPGPRGHDGFDGRCGKNGKHGKIGSCGHRGIDTTFRYDFHAKQICERVENLFGDGHIIIQVDGCIYKATSSQVASSIFEEILDGITV